MCRDSVFAPDVRRAVPGEAVPRVVLLVGLPRDATCLELVHDVLLRQVVDAVGRHAVGGAADHRHVVGLLRNSLKRLWTSGRKDR